MDNILIFDILFISLFNSLIINSVYIMMDEGMILHPLYLMLEKIFRDETKQSVWRNEWGLLWIAKPLYSCVKCMPSVWSLWLLFFFPFFKVALIAIISVYISTFLNSLVYEN